MYLADFVGQRRLKELLVALIARNKPWNVLLRGPYGWGKTTLALLSVAIIGLHTYNLPQRGKLVLSNLVDLHVVDECHLIHSFETLYPAMERCGFIFCSNMASKLPEPFLNRCFVLRMQAYTVEELTQIVGFHSRKNSTPLDEDVARFIGIRSRGTPRTGVMTMLKYSALCKSRGIPRNLSTARDIIEGEFGIDECGLTRLDRLYLEALVDGRPRSVATLASTINVDVGEVQRMEDYFIRMGLVRITSRGRILGT